MSSTTVVRVQQHPPSQICREERAPTAGAGSSASSPQNHEVGEHEADQHPLGVRPSGNALTSETNAQGSMGSFGRLPDSLVLQVLELLDQRALVDLGGTCRGLYAFCACDQVWRELAIHDMSDTFVWRGSWRASLRRLVPSQLAHIDCRDVFSDALHRPVVCAQLALAPYVSHIPARNQICRLNDLSLAEFGRRWTDTPFILTAPVKRWTAYETWTLPHLLTTYGSTTFRAESVDWPLETYVRYMSDTRDESPLYLFDSAFVEKMQLQVGPAGAFEVPDAFREDLFTVLDDERPDHRWLIVGPERSGSTFHKDPNATSAWNAVIRGAKYWIMFPGHMLPPGVYVNDDHSEVTSPLSIAEWLLSFHAEARALPGCVEGVCREGEVLHVPSGWWHLVVNLSAAIAVTQNFVPRAHLQGAATFLRRKAAQVSGFKDTVADPAALFMERLSRAQPVLAAALEEAPSHKRKWEEVVAGPAGDAKSAPAFGFGFGGESDED